EALALRDSGNIVVFWDVDAPATLERVTRHPEDPFRSLIARYDLILTYGGGQPVVDMYRAPGARDCIPIYNALDPLTHHPVEPDPRYTGLLGFLGNRLPDREARVDQYFLEPARRLRDEIFLLGGAGWHENVDAPPNVRRIGHVY